MASSHTPLRVGLLGYGLAGRVFHAPLIASTPGLTLAAVVTRDPARRTALQAAHPSAVVLDTAEALWARAEEIDLVVIATPNRTHAPLAHAALAAGRAVVIDKPFATSAAAARALVGDARARKRLLTVFQNRRWDGDFLTVRRLISEGRVGAVQRFESRYERWNPVPRVGWRESGDPDEASGLLFDLGAHLIDQALQLFGPARAVYAELDRRRPGVVTDDDAFVALEHVGGVRSHLWMSKAAGQPGPRFRVLGDRAAFTKHGLDGQEAALALGGRADAPGWGEEPPARWGVLGLEGAVETVRTEAGSYPQFYAGVAAALREGVPPPVDPEDAIAVLEVIEAARASAVDRRVVQLG